MLNARISEQRQEIFEFGEFVGQSLLHAGVSDLGPLPTTIKGKIKDGHKYPLAHVE